ncbi:MAG TPA: indole-3-glycerol phosphate synthase TrpC [Blastocatellia bacterium]|jgi:indole-3-glycerol phosphate synthase|nr:indole-3-glycerol phosphate synthase TrpC [Blastocatellia bacterium]
MESKTRPKGILAAGGVLDRIVDARAKRVADLKLAFPVNELVTRSYQGSTRPRYSMSEALSQPGRTNIVAEIKHRSPSKGVIRGEFDPVAIAASYEKAGAAALSVLTEEDFFGGSLAHLRAVRERVALPLLRKDFHFDEYQIHEALAAGADAVLLIVAILEDELLTDLVVLASELKIDALVEVHTAREMERAVAAGARIIGVNNRDLTTFTVELATSERLAAAAPRDAVLVSESGIHTGQDIRRLKQAGYNAFLVGEHLMRAADPGEALSRLVATAESE